MYPRLAQIRTPEQFAEHMRRAGICAKQSFALDFDETILPAPDSPLAQPYSHAAFPFSIGNRWCILPMEGWDGEPDGRPSELTARRWQRFGESGAKLIWGGEAVAICPEARANPNQLVIHEATIPDLAKLRETLMRAHAARWNVDDLLIGLQLTHSGRFCRPAGDRPEPRILYSHPILNRKFGLPAGYPTLHDDEIEGIIAGTIRAGVLAQKAGFAFVDIKHCHGYLGHEFLSAVDRPGKYGGSFENRTRYLREIASGIRAAAPGLEIGVRLSAFDFIPFKPGLDGVGEPDKLEQAGIDRSPPDSYRFAFGGDGTGTGIDLTEAHRFLSMLEDLKIHLVNITAGSPYYTPHIQRPAMFPPSDGYLPPEDPLAGVARQVQATAQLKAGHPDLLMVGSGYSYLQEWLPHVAQNVIRTGKADFVGLGRMALAYPEMCADTLAGRPLERKRICRTFSDCTTAPRHGMVSGCYPLDRFYKDRPEAERLAEIKRK